MLHTNAAANITTARRRTVLRTENGCPEGNHHVLPQTRTMPTSTQTGRGDALNFRRTDAPTPDARDTARMPRASEDTDRLHTHAPICQGGAAGRARVRGAKLPIGRRPPSQLGQTMRRFLESALSPATAAPPRAHGARRGQRHENTSSQGGLSHQRLAEQALGLSAEAAEVGAAAAVEGSERAKASDARAGTHALAHHPRRDDTRMERRARRHRPSPSAPTPRRRPTGGRPAAGEGVHEPAPIRGGPVRPPVRGGCRAEATIERPVATRPRSAGRGGAAASERVPPARKATRRTAVAEEAADVMALRPRRFARAKMAAPR